MFGANDSAVSRDRGILLMKQQAYNAGADFMPLTMAVM
jgi:hypothetical protein